MHRLLGRISLGDFLKILNELPKDAQLLPVRFEDDQFGEQANLRFEVVTDENQAPRIILGWYDTGEKWSG
jgi:hypothetical protein